MYFVLKVEEKEEEYKNKEREVTNRSINEFKRKRTHPTTRSNNSIPTERAFLKRGTPLANNHCTTLRRTKKEKETPTQSQHKREKISKKK